MSDSIGQSEDINSANSSPPLRNRRKNTTESEVVTRNVCHPLYVPISPSNHARFLCQNKQKFIETEIQSLEQSLILNEHKFQDNEIPCSMEKDDDDDTPKFTFYNCVDHKNSKDLDETFGSNNEIPKLGTILNPADESFQKGSKFYRQKPKIESELVSLGVSHGISFSDDKTSKPPAVVNQQVIGYKKNRKSATDTNDTKKSENFRTKCANAQQGEKPLPINGFDMLLKNNHDLKEKFLMMQQTYLQFKEEYEAS